MKTSTHSNRRKLRRKPRNFSHNNVFDRLPDEIVISILNKLQDAKSLCSSMSVCQRFHALIPEVRQITFTIPRTKALDQQTQSDSDDGDSELQVLYVPDEILTPLSTIGSLDGVNIRLTPPDSLHSFYESNLDLNPFPRIRSLHLWLRSLKNRSTDSTTSLKWKADFGEDLQNCVFLAADSVIEKPKNKHGIYDDDDDDNNNNNEGNGLESLTRNGGDELKLRYMWAFSCCEAASSRHSLIEEALKHHNMIENVMVSDEYEQGMVSMNREQIQELRESIGKNSHEEINPSMASRIVPVFRMKMWYMRRLELPDSGKVMEGATMGVIRHPPDRDETAMGRRDADLVAAAFGGDMVGEAARKLMKAGGHKAFKCWLMYPNFGFGID